MFCTPCMIDPTTQYQSQTLRVKSMGSSVRILKVTSNIISSLNFNGDFIVEINASNHLMVYAFLLCKGSSGIQCGHQNLPTFRTTISVIVTSYQDTDWAKFNASPCGYDLLQFPPKTAWQASAPYTAIFFRFCIDQLRFAEWLFGLSMKHSSPASPKLHGNILF